MPAQGLPFEVTLAGPMALTTLLDGEVNKRDPSLLRFDAALIVSGRLFDRVDFAQWSPGQALDEAPDPTPDEADDQALMLSDDERFTAPLMERLLNTSRLDPGLTRQALP